MGSGKWVKGCVAIRANDGCFGGDALHRDGIIGLPERLLLLGIMAWPRMRALITPCETLGDRMPSPRVFLQSLIMSLVIHRVKLDLQAPGVRMVLKAPKVVRVPMEILVLSVLLERR